MFINQATAEGIAKIQVDLIAEQIGDAGEIAILSATANATNQNAWIALMKKELAKPDHPTSSSSTTVYGDDDDQTSFDKTAALLQRTRTSRASSRRPRSASPPPPATCRLGVQGQGRADRPRHARTRCASSSRTAPSPRSRCGTRPTSATSPPSPRGARRRHITGEEGDSFEAGKLGEYTVGADGTVLLGEPFTLRRRQHRPVRLLRS